MLCPPKLRSLWYSQLKAQCQSTVHKPALPLLPCPQLFPEMKTEADAADSWLCLGSHSIMLNYEARTAGFHLPVTRHVCGEPQTVALAMSALSRDSEIILMICAASWDHRKFTGLNSTFLSVRCYSSRPLDNPVRAGIWLPRHTQVSSLQPTPCLPQHSDPIPTTTSGTPPLSSAVSLHRDPGNPL